MTRYLSHLAFIIAFASISFISFPLSAASYYTEGHADMGLGEGEELELHLHCHGGAGGSVVDGELLTAGVEYAPSDAIVVVPQSTYYYIHTQGGATGEVVNQLGVSAGADYWFLPQAEETLNGGGASQLFSPHLGLGAEDVEYGVFDDDLITLKLISMTAPSSGQFAMSQNQDWLMSTVINSIDEGDKYADFPVGGHEHVQWYFSKPGVYKITFQSSATISGNPVSDIDTFTFLVGGAVWKGANGSNWNDSGNWISGVPGAGSTVIFTTSSDPNQPLMQNIASPLDLHGIVFTANAGSYQLGGQTIRFSLDSPEITSESPNNQQIANPLDLAVNTAFAVNGSGAVTLSGTVSGGGSLTKTGAGTLVLSNTAGHTGDTMIEEGVLALDELGQIENSAIVNDATFKILVGDHSVSDITGDGATEILSGTLTADSIHQNSIHLGPGSKLILAPRPGIGPLSLGITPVPEPSLGMLLGCLIISSLLIYFRKII